MIRKSLYSGTWYPRRDKEVAQFFDDSLTPRPAIGAVCPHAGLEQLIDVHPEAYDM